MKIPFSIWCPLPVIIAVLLAGGDICGLAQEYQARPNESILAPTLKNLAEETLVFRSAIERIRPSLVSIESFGGISAVPGVIGGIRQQGEGNSTGLVISSDGWIATSTFSFVEKPSTVTVVLQNGKQHVARIAGSDHTRKICLLKIDNVDDLPVAELADPADCFVGQWVLSVGTGFGDTNPAISRGIISAVNRIGGKAIQTDAKISPACYGGPLIDIHGRVAGICVPMNPQSTSVAAGVEWYDSGIGFAVPLATLGPALERLKTGENIFPGFLGISVKPATDLQGVEVLVVAKDSAAQKNGINVGTIVAKIDGENIDSQSTLKQVISRKEAGEVIVINLRQPGDPDFRDVEITLGIPAEFARETPRGNPSR